MKTYKQGLIIIFVVCNLIILLLTACSKNQKEQEIDIFTADWSEILVEAKGQKVLFNAWGGSQEFNEYYQWVSNEVKKKFDIDFTHVLVKDGQEAVRKVQQEKAANVNTGGSVDLIWINGNAFKTMHEENLLSGDILSLLPNKDKLSDNKIFYEDFTIPTKGREVPFGIAQYNFFRRGRVASFESYDELLAVVKRFPKKFTYPAANNDFTGLTFVKGLVYVYASEEDRKKLYVPFTEDFRESLENNPAWELLEKIRPYLWREGKAYPNTIADLHALFTNGEIDYGMSFNYYYALSKKIRGEFSEDIAIFIPKEGTISNSDFITIPYNSGSKAAGLVVINFLISPEAQAKKADLNTVGDPTALKKEYLEQIEQGIAEYKDDPAYPPQGIGRDTIAEFHGSVEKVIRDIWKNKFVQ